MSIPISGRNLAGLGAMALLTVVLRLVFNARYSDAARVLGVVGLTPSPERGDYYRRFDEIYAPLPFLWCWVDIGIFVRVGALSHAALVWIPVMALVAGRMRALQEIGHNAVHYALCRAKEWQWLLANVFFQFPLMKRDMRSRFITHVKDHHRNPNDPDRDPNLRRIIEGGFRPGITRRQFHARLFYPLTPRGFWVNLRTSAINSFEGNASWRATLLRLAAAASAVGFFYFAGGLPGVVLGYVVPLLVVYPFFSWISLLAEHRWFCANGLTGERWQLECTNCRPMAFRGMSGWVARQLVFPLSDEYHLAHSLYQHVRWSYLPIIDRHLRAHDPHYPAFQSEGVLFARGEHPAALSELRDRLSQRNHRDLADWGERFSVTK